MLSYPACDLLRKEHRALENHLGRLSADAQRPSVEGLEKVRHLFGEIRRMDALHFRREEEVLYPSLRSHYPDLLARMDDQHTRIRQVEDRLAELLALRPAKPGPRYLKAVRSAAMELHVRVRHHIVDEEEQLFRMAAACLRPPDQARIAADMAAISTTARGRVA